MKHFKVRDLMINVLSEEGKFQGVGCGPSNIGCGISICPYGSTIICNPPSNIGCGISICPHGSICLDLSIGACDPDVTGCVGPCSLAPCSGNMCTGRCSEGCTAVASLKVDDELQGLAVLKDQLKQAVIQVERRERVLEESMRPQTLEEVELLEEKLTTALEELKVRKVQLQEGPSKEQK